MSLLRCAVTPPALVEILGVDLLTSAFGTLTFVRGVAALIGIIIRTQADCHGVMMTIAIIEISDDQVLPPRPSNCGVHC